jgi:hypothetical protein
MQTSQVRTIARSLPETHERETWGDATFRVREKIFLILRADGERAMIKCSLEEQHALVGSDPSTFSVAPYLGRHGWVDVALPRVAAGEMRELLTEAWRLTAPKRLVRSFDEGRS